MEESSLVVDMARVEIFPIVCGPKIIEEVVGAMTFGVSPDLYQADFVNQELRDQAISQLAYQLWKESDKSQSSSFYWFQAAKKVDAEWLFAYMNSPGYEANERKRKK